MCRVHRKPNGQLNKVEKKSGGLGVSFTASPPPAPARTGPAVCGEMDGRPSSLARRSVFFFFELSQVSVDWWQAARNPSVPCRQTRQWGKQVGKTSVKSSSTFRTWLPRLCHWFRVSVPRLLHVRNSQARLMSVSTGFYRVHVHLIGCYVSRFVVLYEMRRREKEFVS
jgi:hypothetical protein